MISKVQLLKSAIDCHSAVRYLQRKFNLDGFRYRQICGDDNEFDPLLETKTPEKEKLDVNNEFFHFSDISGDQKVDSRVKVKIPRQGSTVQQNTLEEFHHRKRPCKENQNYTSEVLNPTHTKTVQKVQLEAKPKGFHESKSPCHENSNASLEERQLANTKAAQKEQLEPKPADCLDSKSSCHENSNSSLEDRQLANTEPIHKEQLPSKSKGFLDGNGTCHATNSVSEVGKSAHSMTAQQKILELKSEGFLEIKISRAEKLDPTSEVSKTRHSKSVQQENLELKPEGFLRGKSPSENHISFLEVRKPADTKTFPKKQLESKLEGVDFDSKSCRDENSDSSLEVRKPRHTKKFHREDVELKPESFHCTKGPCQGSQDPFSEVRKPEDIKTVQSKDLDFKPKSCFHYVKSPSHGTPEPSSEVRKPQPMKTVQPNDLKFSSKSIQSNKRHYGHESKNPSLAVSKPLRAETVQQESLELKTEGVQCSNSSIQKHLNHSSGGKRPRYANAVYKKKQGFRYRQLPCDVDMEVKKDPQQKKPVQNKNLTPVHQEVCRVPSWKGNEMAIAKLSQRRTAVCDNIERELTNQSGISLRKMRKYLVVTEILKEVNLL